MISHLPPVKKIPTSVVVLMLTTLLSALYISFIANTGFVQGLRLKSIDGLFR